jgi:hypothetical protein
MTADIDSTLAALMPTERHFVMDLLEQAGLDVAPWRVTGDGKAFKTPRANPAYCYDWAFGNEAEVLWSAPGMRERTAGEYARGWGSEPGSRRRHQLALPAVRACPSAPPAQGSRCSRPAGGDQTDRKAKE